MNDLKIRKVRTLTGAVKAEAAKQGLKPDDLVIVRGVAIEKIEGEPLKYLQKKVA